MALDVVKSFDPTLNAEDAPRSSLDHFAARILCALMMFRNR